MRISLALVLLLSSEVWAIGLGEINLDSALNEPLRAEIVLLSATPEELSSLVVSLASAETFDRYGIDRPFYLQEIEFNVLSSGPDGPVVQVRSRSPITEPFLTFLVEATWSSGRLIREYTVLLDPPTYAPPAVQQAPAVEAPRRATPTDSARIERQPPAPAPQPEPAQPTYTPPPSRPATQPAPVIEERAEPVVEEPVIDRAPYSGTSGGDVYVERGNTLWGIASRMRPDSRLTMNQTMLAIYEANPHAFSGNINQLKAGVTLRVPSADEVFQISRGDAFSEVRRQNEEWRDGEVFTPDTRYDDTDYSPSQDAASTSETAKDTTETRPSLTLVPPDEEPAGIDYDDELDTSEPPSREQEIESRIAELEAADVPDQQSLIEIRDNELAALRQELAEIRGEIYEVPADEVVTDDTPSTDEVFVDDEAIADEDEAAVDEAADAEPEPATKVIRTPRVSEPSIMDRILGVLGSFWTKIIAALVLVAGVLLWFVRRGRGEDDDLGPLESLDGDDLAAGSMTGTERISAPVQDHESIVVVEQDSGIRPMDDDTIEAPLPDVATDIVDIDIGTPGTGGFGSLEDTFSSDTAVNLDQTDPLAEADFHMAYGLYDQAADLINGALEADPNDKVLMSKLCEIYFVWGNRDAFVDAATRLKTAIGDGDSADWDKIVIMGQQLAGNHELFEGAGVAGATKAVDLSFEPDMGNAAELDMDFGGEGSTANDVIDLGAGEADDAVDLLFEDGADGGEDSDATKEMPQVDEPTAETLTIERQYSGMDATAELPALDNTVTDAVTDAEQAAEPTQEINLDELDLDISGMVDEIDDTGINEALRDFEDDADRDLAMDFEETSRDLAMDLDQTGMGEALDLGDLEDLEDFDSTGMRLAADETGRMPLLDVEKEMDTSTDEELLDATGHTQILSDDMAVETGVKVDADLGDDDATLLAPGYGGEDTEVADKAETLLAPLDDDDEEIEFAKTEALPADVFAGKSSLDETAEMSAIAGTDLDLDLDDLTAALQVSEAGDTIEEIGVDETVEQPRPSASEEAPEAALTMSIAPEDLSDDLHDARTMTEVGTKLDLARAYVDMGDPAGARSILEEVLDEGDEAQRQQAQQLLDSLPG
jgi:pilus assembly protein FimV